MKSNHWIRSERKKKFDATEYTRNYLDHVLPASYEKTISILDLIELLQRQIKSI